MFCCPSAILRATESVSALTRVLLYCCALYNSFFLGFHRWRSRADRVLTLKMNIRLPLFWSTWSRARGPDSATCAGLAHGRDYSDCRASELNLQKCLASVFLELSKILEKQWPAVGFFNPHPPDCLNPLIISFRLKTLNEWLHENLHQKSAS